jgi:hypothetical protein
MGIILEGATPLGASENPAALTTTELPLRGEFQAQPEKGVAPFSIAGSLDVHIVRNIPRRVPDRCAKKGWA